MSLKVISKPRCPKCKGRDTERYGYLKEKGGSEYGCRKCLLRFIVPSLRVKIQEVTQTRS